MSIVASLFLGCFLGRCWFLRFFGAIFCYYRALRVSPAVTRLTVYRGFAVLSVFLVIVGFFGSLALSFVMYLEHLAEDSARRGANYSPKIQKSII